MKHSGKIRGDVRITETDTRTGESTVIVEDKNIIVNEGLGLIAQSLNPRVLSGFKLGVIKFGNDVGNGTELLPQPPTGETSKLDQNVVISIPENRMNYSTVGDALLLSASINGKDVIPDDVDYIKYTSSAIYSELGEVFSYKRFPFRVFSKYIRINVEWVISTTNENGGGGGECPIVPFVTGVLIDAPETDVAVDDVIVIRGFERRNDGTLVTIPNGDRWTTSNPNVSLSSGDNGTVLVTGNMAGNTTITVRSEDFETYEILRVTEKIDPSMIMVFSDSSPADYITGAEFNVRGVYDDGGGVQTDVTVAADWTVSDNLTIISETANGVLIRIDSPMSQSRIEMTYDNKAASYVFDAISPIVVTAINLTPYGSSRFDLGEHLDIKAVVMYSDGTTRLATIDDRWVYNKDALNLSEVGVVGNLRITGTYYGEYSVRVYIDGVEGKIDIKIAPTIVTTSVSTFPQSPLYVIPGVKNTSYVYGVQSEGENIVIDEMYMSGSGDLVVGSGWVETQTTGEKTIRVIKDGVDTTLDVISSTMSTLPLTLTMCECVGLPEGTVTFDIRSPVDVYIDVDNNIRRYYNSNSVVTLNYSPNSVIKIYGGCDKLIINGGVKIVEDWGEFQCNSYEISSAALVRVPYTIPNITTMENMFNGSTTFNQNLSAWCVTDFATKPAGFDEGCVGWTKPRPLWGTCPNPNEIYRFSITPGSNVQLALGETTVVTFSAYTRMDVLVPYDPSFIVEYDDSIIFVDDNGDGTHTIGGVRQGQSNLSLSNGTVSTSLQVNVA